MEEYLKLLADFPHRVFDITPDPLTKNPRKVFVEGYRESVRTGEMQIDCMVITLDEKGEVVRTMAFRPYLRPLRANLERQVNPLNGVNAELVTPEPTEEQPEPSSYYQDLLGNRVENPVPQYIFFEKALQPIFLQLIPQVIGQDLTLGTFDREPIN